MIAVGTDPFTQQIISFETNLVPLDGGSSQLKTSQVYDWRLEGEPYPGGVTFKKPRDIPLGRAVSLALYSALELPDLSCPGSACRYPQFVSIGTTSTCQDVTALVQENCTSANNGIRSEVCTFTTPGGFDIYGSSSHAGMWGNLQTRFNTTIGSRNSPYDTKLLRFGVGRFPSETYNWTEGKLIYECTFELVALEYTNWNITNATIHPGSATPYHLNFTDSDPAGGPSEINWYTTTDPAYSHDRKFGINVLDLTHISAVLDAAVKSGSSNSGNNQGVQAFLAESVNLALYNSPDIPATMKNISAAISYRMLGGPNATITEVPVLNQEIVIAIRWVWISLPAALVIITCLFLLIIVYRTNKQEHLIWKSSLTPLLLSQESYPVLNAGQKPLWTRTYLKARTAEVVNHLTK
ncbi:hypothetical protein PG993_002357 [Apiospora rasikravindrae]|uniref:Uncharacterized protein n=1 Tax=Apiospora rasikravindrae TaxID=990691 RepID=A0ABR1TWH9_9PEZI